VFDAGGIGAGEKVDGVTWSAGTPGPLVVIERKLPRVTSPEARHTTVGLDTEYALSLRLKP